MYLISSMERKMIQIGWMKTMVYKSLMWKKKSMLLEMMMMMILGMFLIGTSMINHDRI